MNADAWPSGALPDLASYAPGPGMSACSFWYGSSRAGWREPKPGFERLMRSTDLATDCASEPSVWDSYVPGPTPMSVDVFSVANRCALLRMPEPPFCMPGSTADILGSYAPTPGVGLARSLPRCADDERKADDGIAEPSDSSFLARYVPGPGVSSPMMSSFISRADAPPKPPEPARFERPKERAESAARSCVAKGSYAPGSPVAASTSPRALLLLKAELAAAPFLGVKTLYEPGPGVADLRDSIARDLMAWKAARSDGEAPRAELEPEAGMARLFEGGRVGTPRADLARSTRGFQELRASSVTATVTGCPRKNERRALS